MEEETKSVVHQPHDKAYKMLLSNKKVFIELLQSFVGKHWVEQIDEASLTKVDKTYILQDFREKESDIVPVVLYNGKEPWNASVNFRDTIDHEHLFGDELLE